MRVGKLTSFSIQFLKLLYSFFGVKFQIIVRQTSLLKGHQSDEEKNIDESDSEDEQNINDIEKRYNSTILSCKGIS